MALKTEKDLENKKFTQNNGNFGLPFSVSTYRAIIDDLNTLTDSVAASGTLAETLTLGKITGGNDIQMTNDDAIAAVNGGGHIDLRAFSTNGNIGITTDSGAYGVGCSWLYQTQGNSTQVAYQVGASEAVGFMAIGSGLTPLAGGSWSFVASDNTSAGASSGTGVRRACFVGAQNSSILSGVTNSVVVAANARTGSVNNTLYTSNFDSSGTEINSSVTTSSGAGAVAITGIRHDVTTTGTGDALTLANGVTGQKLKIVYVAEGAGGDTAVLTPTTLLGYTSITFNAIGDSVELSYGTGGWAIISEQGTTLA